MLGDIFFGDHLINFGEDTRYSQRNNFNTRPNIPNLFNIKRFLDIQAGYNVDYSWQNTLTRGDLGKSTGYNANINFSVNFRMKQLFDPLFETKPGAAPPAAPARGRRGSGETEALPGATDSTKVVDSTASVGGMDKLLGQLGVWPVS